MMERGLASTLDSDRDNGGRVKSISGSLLVDSRDRAEVGLIGCGSTLLHPVSDEYDDGSRSSSSSLTSTTARLVN
mgnify:CR=1 FL=1